MLDGECKIEFEKWYYHNEAEYELGISGGHSGKLHPSREWGVIVDFFDSVGIWLIEDVEHKSTGHEYSVKYKREYNMEFGLTYSNKSRNEARSAAITKANELFNLRSKA